MYPDSLNNLIESFKSLPGIGAKTAERLAFALLELEKEQIEMFSSIPWWKSYIRMPQSPDVSGLPQAAH